MTVDLLILGGGLAGGLLARALAAKRPELSFLLVEGGDTLGGNHVWSFFEGDVDPADRWLVDPLISHRWPDHEVRFPAYTRVIAQAYHSIESTRFDRILRAELGDRVVHGQVVEAGLDQVRLADGRVLRGTVLDARGPGDLSQLDLGWQKFVGITLRTAAPHGVERPVIMDATVPQLDGYRFVYLLPFGPNELFVEDTYYSDTADLDVERIKGRILAYASGAGWDATPTNHLETGVLPVIIGGDFEGYWRSTGSTAKAGMRAALCHPTTGYSLPDAVRFARAVVTSRDLSPAALERLTKGYAAQTWDSRRFYRLLDTMLFRAAAPAERFRVLQHFYTKPDPLVARFYAGQTTLRDAARILVGRPPVPISRAVGAILERFR